MLLQECEQRFDELERRVAALELRVALLEKFFGVLGDCAKHLAWQDGNTAEVDHAE